MATLTRFQDIDCWKLSRSLVKKLYAITNSTPISKDFPLRDQMRRAGISIMSNIAEGFERDGNKEFINFLSIAKASSAELYSQMYIALDASHIDQKMFGEMEKELQNTMRSIGGFIRYLKESDFRGYKFTEEEFSYIKGEESEECN